MTIKTINNIMQISTNTETEVLQSQNAIPHKKFINGFLKNIFYNLKKEVYYFLRSQIGTFEKRLNFILILGDSSLSTATPTPLIPQRGKTPPQIRSE